jgi:hypothetical protein
MTRVFVNYILGFCKEKLSEGISDRIDPEARIKKRKARSQTQKSDEEFKSSAEKPEVN